MYNLNLTDICVSDGIIVRPYEYSFEELIDIINDRDDSALLAEFERFCDEVVVGLDMFHNAMTIEEYIGVHGVDPAIKELIGNESVLASVKNVVVSFAKWIWEKLSALFNWFRKLFTGNRNVPDGDNPKEIAKRIVDGNDAQRKKEIEKLRKLPAPKAEPKASPTNQNKPQPPEQKTAPTKPQLAKQEDTAPTRRIYAYGISLPCNPKELYGALSNIRKMIEAFTRKGIDGLHDFPLFRSNEYKNEQNAADMFADWYDVLTKAAHTKACSLTRAETIDFIDTISSEVAIIRTHANSLSHEMNKIPKLPNDISPEQADKYIQSVCNALHINIGNDDRKTALHFVKLWITGVRSMAAIAFKCDRIILPLVMQAVSMLYNDANTQEDNQRAKRLNARSMMLDGAVDVRVAVPESLMKRMQQAWGADKFKVKRVIITNSRDTRSNHSDSGLQGVAHSSNLFVAYEDIKSIGVNAEVVINYGYFKSQLRFKQNVNDYKKALNNRNISALTNNINVDDDRINSLFITIIHECRHVWQNWYKKHTNDRDKDTATHKEYLDLEHERDARKAAIEFKATDEDREWIKSLLERCLKQEYSSIVKYNNPKKN